MTRRVTILARSAFGFSAAEVLNRLINLVTMMIASRHYGVAEFGRFGAAFALTGILAVFTCFIAPANLTRDLCQRPNERLAILVSYLWQRLFVMIGSSAFLVLVLSYGDPRQMALALFCYLFLYNLQTVMNARSGLMSQELFHLAALSSVVHSVLILLGAYVPVRLGLSLEMMTASLAASQVIALGFVLLLSAAHGYPLRQMARQRIDWAYMAWDLKRNLPLWLALSSIAGYSRINVVLCQALQGDYETGLFTAAQRFFLGFSLIAAIYQQVTYPRMVRDVEDAERTGAYMESSGRLLMVAGQLVAVLATLGGMGLMAAIWGRGFGASATATQVLIWALGVSFMNQVFSNILIAEGRPTMFMWITMAALAVNVAANLALIAPLGAVGASAASVMTEASVLAGMLWSLRAYHRTWAVLSATARSTAAAATVIIAARWAGLHGVPALVTVPAGSLLYLAAAWLTGVIPRHHLADVFRRLMPEPQAAADAPVEQLNGRSLV